MLSPLDKWIHRCLWSPVGSAAQEAQREEVLGWQPWAGLQHRPVFSAVPPSSLSPQTQGSQSSPHCTGAVGTAYSRWRTVLQASFQRSHQRPSVGWTLYQHYEKGKGNPYAISNICAHKHPCPRSHKDRCALYSWNKGRVRWGQDYVRISLW